MEAEIPRVSVLVTTHNGAATLGETLCSILAQDMSDFELIVVDDASTDGTAELLKTVIYPRLINLRSNEQLGIAHARNLGLLHCRAPYIATLDHDDISDPRRLRLQSSYLDAHPKVVAAASAVRELREKRLVVEDQPTSMSFAQVRLLLHLDNPLAWSSIMFRADVLRSLAQPVLSREFEPADDFDLYHRLLELGHIARIDLPLTSYRWHASNATHRLRVRIIDGATRVLARAYRPWFGADASAAAALIVRHCNERVVITDAALMSRVHDIVRRVARALAETYPADRSEIAKGERLVRWRLTRAAVRSGYPTLFRLPAPALDAIVSIVVGFVRTVLRRLLNAQT